MRIVVYLVLVTALGLIVWKIYQNQKLTAANERQPGGGADEPAGSGAGGSRRAEADADLPDRAGHGDALHERDGQGAGQRRAASR